MDVRNENELILALRAANQYEADSIEKAWKDAPHDFPAEFYGRVMNMKKRHKTGVRAGMGRASVKKWFLLAAVLIAGVTTAVTASQKIIKTPHYDENGIKLTEYSPGMIISREEITRYMTEDVRAEEVSREDRLDSAQLQIGQMVILAATVEAENYEGWKLRKGREVILKFEVPEFAHARNILDVSQALRVGYIYEGKIYEQEYTYQNEDFICSAKMEILDRGEYYFFVTNACSEDLVLKNIIIR